MKNFSSGITATIIIAAQTYGFTISPPSLLASLPKIGGRASSSVVLYDSRKRQKIASRTRWLEKRGYDSDGNKILKEGDPGLWTNDSGLKYVRLVHPDTGASSEVYVLGGVVTSYKDPKGYDFIAVRPDAKMDGSKPISGGLSHCWPQFGPGEIQQHGFARNVNWEVATMTETSVEMKLKPSEYTKEMWDKQFLCTFSVTLEEDRLATKMVVENKGEESFDFQAALHSYLTVSSLSNLEIAGSFEGTEFLNKLAGDEGEMQKEERGVITIAEEYDRVYKGVNDPVLTDKGAKRMLKILNNEGYEDTVVWNPYGNEAMGYDNFVCVESVKFDPVTLDAGATWVGDMALQSSIVEVEEVAEEAASSDAEGTVEEQAAQQESDEAAAPIESKDETT